MHNLLCFVVHLHLLLGVTVIGKDIDLRNYVEGQLIGKLLDGWLLACQYLTVLFVELSHGSGTGTACSLIAGNVDAPDVADILQSLQGNNHHDCGTVGVGDDIAGTVQSILGIALGNYQGHILFHTEGAAVIYHHGTVLGNGLGKLLACTASCAGKSDIHTLEVVVMLQQLHFNFLSAEGILCSCTALASKEKQLVNGEISLIQNSQEFLTYGTAGTNNCNFHM